MEMTFLNGLEHRMRFIAMTEAIVRRSGRDMELERLFGQQELDSLIVAVLVFVMEDTLAENRECTLDSIEAFLGKLLSSVKPEFPMDRLHDLTNYIVKIVLKNDGEPRYYTVLHPEKGFQPIRIDFLADQQQETGTSYRITYQLTDQAYDFLFRTKEVENELRFTMEELKLRELIRRKNYKKAAQQSANLTQMIRQKKRELSQFQEKVRDNVLGIDVGEYETLYKSTFELLDEEYGIMQEIREMLRLAYSHLQEEEGRRGTLDDEMISAMHEMERIRINLDTAVTEQRTMILERHSISNIYAEIMKEALTRRLMNRYDFEDEIMKPLEQTNEDGMLRIWKLLNPLFMPSLPKWLGLSDVYAPQAKLKLYEEKLQGIEQEDLDQDSETQRIQKMNLFHVKLIEELLHFSSLHAEGFRFDAFYRYIEKLPVFMQSQPEDSSLFQIILRLYEAGIIDVAAWKAEKAEVVESASGEFDLEYCLYRVEVVEPELFGIRKIKLDKPDEQIFETVIRKEMNGAWLESKLTMNNFAFQVERTAE